MAGEDLTSAALAAPPRPPLDELQRADLCALTDEVCAATWKLGLRSWFWGEGVCLLGMLRAAASRGLPPPVRVLDFVTEHAAAGIALDHVNNLAPAAAAAVAARATGRADLRRVVLDCLAWLEGPAPLTRAPNGALEHWPGGVWADTVFMAGSFLLHAGRLLDRDDLVAAAVRQWIAHAEVLQHPDSGLFAHGSHRGETIWCFWGRGNAWTALAGVELVELAGAAPGMAEVRERLRDQLRALAACQPTHGVWDVLVDGRPENRGILETSAAAGIGAAMLRAAACPALPPDEAAALDRAGCSAVRGALAYLTEGQLARVSAGTVLQLVPFGYSVIRDDRPQPWGQGLALHALAAAIDRQVEPVTVVNGTGVIACIGEPLVCFSSPAGSTMLDSPCAEVGEGGAEFNVAVHLARLGRRVRFVGAVGDDVLGRRIEQRLRLEGVDVSALHREPGGHTGAYVKDWSGTGRNVVYLRTGTAASRLNPPPETLRGVSHVHLSGITAALSEQCAGLLDRLLARPRGYTVSFDVNYREKLWPPAAAAACLARMADAADLVLVGQDEAQLLWGTATAADVRHFLTGPAELVAKDDGRAATAWTGHDRIALAPPPAEVVEPVGAGDAFAAGYLHSRLRGDPPVRAIAVGHRLAREALQAGDDLGRPVPPAELHRLLETER